MILVLFKEQLRGAGLAWSQQMQTDVST